MVHFLVNNAGAGTSTRHPELLPAPVTDLRMKSVRMIYDVNVFGVMEVTHTFIPLLLATKDASIVNVASMGAIVPSPVFTLRA